MRGLGDVVEKIADVIGIEKCGNCNERHTKLNQLFPFKTATELSSKELDYLSEVFSWYKGLPIAVENVQQIVECEQIWLRAFNIKTASCKSCGAGYQNNYMTDLKKLWESQKK